MRIVNSWKLLLINYCLKEAHLRGCSVPGSDVDKFVFFFSRDFPRKWWNVYVFFSPYIEIIFHLLNICPINFLKVRNFIDYVFNWCLILILFPVVFKHLFLFYVAQNKNSWMLRLGRNKQYFYKIIYEYIK